MQIADGTAVPDLAKLLRRVPQLCVVLPSITGGSNDVPAWTPATGQEPKPSRGHWTWTSWITFLWPRVVWE